MIDDAREPDGLVVLAEQVMLAVAVRAGLNAPGVEHTVDFNQKDRTAGWSGGHGEGRLPGGGLDGRLGVELGHRVFGPCQDPPVKIRQRMPEEPVV